MLVLDGWVCATSEFSTLRPVYIYYLGTWTLRVIHSGGKQYVEQSLVKAVIQGSMYPTSIHFGYILFVHIDPQGTET